MIVSNRRKRWLLRQSRQFNYSFEPAPGSNYSQLVTHPDYVVVAASEGSSVLDQVAAARKS